MIELKEIQEAWGYGETLLKKSEDLHDIIITLIIHCREHYGVIGMDYPRFQISINNNFLDLECGVAFYDLNTDEKVIKYVKDWYEKNKEDIKKSSYVKK